MFHWEKVKTIEICGMSVKMYRPIYEPLETQKAPAEALELDHYAYKYLRSEVYMYKVLDTNWEEYMEERGDVARVHDIKIPIKEKWDITF